MNFYFPTNNSIVTINNCVLVPARDNTIELIGLDGTDKRRLTDFNLALPALLRKFHHFYRVYFPLSQLQFQTLVFTGFDFPNNPEIGDTSYSLCFFMKGIATILINLDIIEKISKLKSHFDSLNLVITGTFDNQDDWNSISSVGLIADKVKSTIAYFSNQEKKSKGEILFIYAADSKKDTESVNKEIRDKLKESNIAFTEIPSEKDLKLTFGENQTLRIKSISNTSEVFQELLGPDWKKVLSSLEPTLRNEHTRAANTQSANKPILKNSKSDYFNLGCCVGSFFNYLNELAEGKISKDDCELLEYINKLNALDSAQKVYYDKIFIEVEAKHTEDLTEVEKKEKYNNFSKAMTNFSNVLISNIDQSDFQTFELGRLIWTIPTISSAYGITQEEITSISKQILGIADELKLSSFLISQILDYTKKIKEKKMNGIKQIVEAQKISVFIHNSIANGSWIHESNSANPTLLEKINLVGSILIKTLLSIVLILSSAFIVYLFYKGKTENRVFVKSTKDNSIYTAKKSNPEFGDLLLAIKDFQENFIQPTKDSKPADESKKLSVDNKDTPQMNSSNRSFFTFITDNFVSFFEEVTQIVMIPIKAMAKVFVTEDPTNEEQKDIPQVVTPVRRQKFLPQEYQRIPETPLKNYVDEDKAHKGSKSLEGLCEHDCTNQKNMEETPLTQLVEEDKNFPNKKTDKSPIPKNQSTLGQYDPDETGEFASIWSGYLGIVDYQEAEKKCRERNMVIPSKNLINFSYKRTFERNWDDFSINKEGAYYGYWVNDPDLKQYPNYFDSSNARKLRCIK